MPDIDKLATRAGFIVPVVHLMACGLYMAGYSAGFGGNIGGMFSASDFFTITIQHLIATYVFGLGMPVLVIILRHRSGHTYAVDVIAKETDPAKRVEMEATRKAVVSYSTLFLPLFAILPLSLLALQIWAGGYREYYLTLELSILGLFPFWWKMAERLDFQGLPVELAWCAMSFAVSVFALGLNVGDRDRRFSYGDIAEGRMRCGQQVVLSPIGDRFLSVTPDNHRHLVSEECKVLFDFMPTNIVPSDSLFELVRKKLAA